jgi:hypothetical protein
LIKGYLAQAWHCGHLSIDDPGRKEEIEMKSIKKMLVALLAVAVMLSGLSATTFAAVSSSVTKQKLKVVRPLNETVDYTGSRQTAKYLVLDAEGNELQEGTDYRVIGNSGTSCGTYYVTVQGIGRFTGAFSRKFVIKSTASAAEKKVTVASVANKLGSNATIKNTSSGSTVTVKQAAVKSADAKIQLNVTKSSSNTGKVTYEITSTPSNGSKYIKVNSLGKVTLKKGAPKGTYKITVRVAGNGNYNPATKTITITIK